MNLWTKDGNTYVVDMVSELPPGLVACVFNEFIVVVGFAVWATQCSAGMLRLQMLDEVVGTVLTLLAERTGDSTLVVGVYFVLR